MRKHTRGVVAVACVLAATLSAAGCGNGAGTARDRQEGLPEGPIKLGALFTLSGPSAPIGLSQKRAFEVLVDRLNQQGGIAGHQVELVAYNDKGDPAVAVSSASKLINDDVAAIVYHGTSATSSQTVPVFNKGKVLQVVVDSGVVYGDPAKTPYTFVTYPNDDQTMTATLRYAKRQGAKRLGMIADGLPFGEHLEAGMRRAVKAEPGVALVGPVSYSPTAVDVTTQLRQLKSQGVDGIVVLGSTGVGHIYDGLRTIGWSPRIYGSESARFVGYDEIGSLSDRMVTTCAVPLKQGTKPDAGADAVLEAVSDKNGVTPSTPTAVIFNDDLGIVKTAIEKTKSVDGDELREAVEQMQDFSYTTPTYRYSFSPTQHNGFPSSEVGLCRIKPMGPYDYPYAADDQ